MHKWYKYTCITPSQGMKSHMLLQLLGMTQEFLFFTRSLGIQWERRLCQTKTWLLKVNVLLLGIFESLFPPQILFKLWYGYLILRFL